MNEKIVKALIKAVSAIVVAAIGVFAGIKVEQRNTQTQIKEVMGNVINVNGDVTVNDIENFMQKHIQLQSNYDSLSQQNDSLNQQNNYLNQQNDSLSQQNDSLSQQNDSLVKQNTKYFNDLNEANNKIKDLQSQLDKEINGLQQELNSMPIVTFLNLGLCVDGDDKVVNMTDSVAMVNGKEYWNRELVKHLIEKNKTVTIQDSKIYIGKVITEKASLFDQYTMDRNSFDKNNIAGDSYGNTYSNVLTGRGYYNGYIMYNVKREFSYLKFKAAASSGFSSSSKAIITILADDEVIYTSDEIFQTTEPFEVNDLPINNCSRLKITVSGNMHSEVIIADAVLYN